MTRLPTLLALVACFGLAAPRPTLAVIVSDVQVQALAGDRWQTTLRSDGPLAFDVTSAGRRTTIRLHQAALARMVKPGKAAFGRIKLRGRRDGEVIVRLRMRRGWRAAVRQGGSPNVVIIRAEAE